MGQKIDVLNRDAFIVKLMTLVETLSLKKQGCCFGVNGAWGSGKSFVLERFEEKMQGLGAKMERVDNVKDLQLFKYREG